MNIVFSVFIDIPEAKLDNPGYYIDNILVDTDKSLKTKNALLNNADELKRRHKEYADSIGAEYILFEYKSSVNYLLQYLNMIL